MPLIACPECLREISDLAPACPHCGFPRGVTLAGAGAPASRAAGLATAPAIQRSPLQEIAYRQKLLLYAVLTNILCQLPLWYFLESPWLAPVT